MAYKRRFFRKLELTAWILGLAVAGLGDYLMIPAVRDATGQLWIAIAIGLPWGLLVMFVFAETGRRLSDGIDSRDGDKANADQDREKKKVPLATRISTVIIVALTIASLLLTGLPVTLFR